MPSPVETTTRVLTIAEYRLGMAEAQRFYESVGVQNVLVAYGWSCNCPRDELYIDKLIAIDQFQRFVSAAETANYYRVGDADLYFKDESGQSAFLFCHESDIHFTAEDPGLHNQVQALWKRLGFQATPPAAIKSAT